MSKIAIVIFDKFTDVDLEIIWNITQDDSGNLKTEIEKILEELNK